MRTWITHTLTVLLSLQVSAQTGGPASQAKPVDPLAPRISAEGAAIGPLHTITVSTHDVSGPLTLFRDGLGMRVRGPVDLTPDAKTALRTRWGLGPDSTWSMYLFDRPSTPGTVGIRLLVFDHAAPAIRQTWNPREPGPFTLGFPTSTLTALDSRLRSLGFESLAPMERSRIPRPDGTSYGLEESVFKGPDGVHAVLVSRLDGMPQLGPVDAVTGHGGPAYSAQVVTDSDAIVRFYCDVLGMELRSDREWKSGANSAIGLPAGTPFRMALLYAPGTSSGQLLLMDFRGRTAPGSGVVPRPPNRGIGMYTFPVTDLGKTAARARAAGVSVVSGPLRSDVPGLGPHRALTLVAPNGVLVELVEWDTARRP